jgi:hypothetical protein
MEEGDEEVLPIPLPPIFSPLPLPRSAPLETSKLPATVSFWSFVVVVVAVVVIVVVVLRGDTIMALDDEEEEEEEEEEKGEVRLGVTVVVPLVEFCDRW